MVREKDLKRGFVVSFLIELAVMHNNATEQQCVLVEVATSFIGKGIIYINNN
jgi:hypothetical protein